MPGAVVGMEHHHHLAEAVVGEEMVQEGDDAVASFADVLSLIYEVIHLYIQS